MWLSLNILSKMVDINGINPEELAGRLTMATAEIEDIEEVNHHLKNIVTGKILTVQKHPDADKLTLVDVDIKDETLRVVCGAPNHKEGDIVPVAKVGTKFSDDFVIKKSKIRGEESYGMLCSERELGFSDSHAGIMILPENTEIGIPLNKLFPEWIDTKLEIDNKSITHRPDLWSHMGFAREAGALFGRVVKNPVNHDLEKTFGNEDNISISIENPEAAPRYSCLCIKNIKIAESPEWLKAMVSSIGMRPINNIVDITNYVMVELGEPLHAFDRKKLSGNEIKVRMGKNGELLTTLDDQKHELTDEDIVIADESGAIALAGVMGGGNSEIDDSTETIILEAANFNPVNIRKTAGRFNLRTEAAIRFEKSLSPELTKDALLRCYELIKEIIPEAEAVTPVIDAYPVKPQSIRISISSEKIRQQMGEDIPDSRIEQIISSLGFDIKKDGSVLNIRVPHYRATKDISIPADIVEEVGRIYGYDNISPSSPFVPCMPPEGNPKRTFERKVKEILSFECAMTEVSAYSFVGEQTLEKLKINHDLELRLRNPLSKEQDRLRRNLIPNVMEMIALNQRYQESFSIYELGRVYLKDDRKSKDLINEKFAIIGAFYKKKPETALFYNAKAAVATLLEKTRIKKASFRTVASDLPAYVHPGRAMEIIVNGDRAGLVYEIHPAIADDFDLNGKVAFFEIDFDMLFLSDKKDYSFAELQKFPEVPFELSVLGDRNTYAGEICSIILGADQKYIKTSDVISIYEGEQIPEGKKSISVRTVFSAKDKTLESSEIEELQKKVISALNKKGYSLR